MTQDTSKLTSMPLPVFLDPVSPYQRWLASLDVPVHRGYYVEDLRTLELGWWEERGCNAAFLELAGQEGRTEARVTEIPPGQTLPPVKFMMDEVVYVVQGSGLTTVWDDDAATQKTFEWQKHSLFVLPRGTTHQFSNATGDSPARLLHQNYLPSAMSVLEEPGFFFGTPHTPVAKARIDLNETYAVAQAVRLKNTTGWAGGKPERTVWYGNFFPDMNAWDKLETFRGRGAGGHVVYIQFGQTQHYAHMSVFPTGTYKKAHRHGPAVVIVIPGGEGFSVMWPEGQEKVIIPWHEASVFVPPNRWYHQHFNVAGAPARYLALHGPGGRRGGSTERVGSRRLDQIEYPEEDPMVRQYFEDQLAQRGLKSNMPDRAYTDPDFEWDYEEND